MQTVCEAHMHAKHTCMRSTHACEACHANLGGLGACPPENFEKLHPLRLNLGAFLMIYDPLATLYYLIT